MTASLWLTAVQALATAWSAMPGYRAFGSSTAAAATVYVGGQVDDENNPGADRGYVVVGYGGTPERPASSGSFRQTRGPMAAAHPRDEAAQIRVRCVAQPGDGGVLAAALTCEGYLHDLESLLTTNPTLGISAPVSRRFLAELDAGGSWALRPTTDGPQAVLDATVTYTARL